MMPDDRARVEAEGPPPLAQPPADVDVVPGGPELRVEPLDLQERRPSERHVAARDVLGFLVGEQDVDGPPGALATASATGPSPGGGMFGPPMPTWVDPTNAAARYRSQSGSG